MSNGKSSRSANLTDWLRLQQKLVTRSSEYVQALGELVGSGSFETREYVQESAKAWAGVVGDLGEWLKPESDSIPDEGEAVVCVCRGTVERNRETERIKVEVPAALFGDDEKAEVELTAGPLVRQIEVLGRPPSVLEPDKHLRVEPGRVSRANRRTVSLAFFGLSGIGEKGIYEGILWARKLSSSEAAQELPKKTKKTAQDSAKKTLRSVAKLKPAAVIIVQLS